jgi:preprotein translocase subunit YajC
MVKAMIMVRIKVGDMVKLEGGRIGTVVDIYKWGSKIYWVRLEGEMNIKILVQDANSKVQYEDLPKAKPYSPFLFRQSGD